MSWDIKKLNLSNLPIWCTVVCRYICVISSDLLHEYIHLYTHYYHVRPPVCSTIHPGKFILSEFTNRPKIPLLRPFYVSSISHHCTFDGNIIKLVICLEHCQTHNNYKIWALREDQVQCTVTRIILDRAARIKYNQVLSLRVVHIGSL